MLSSPTVVPNATHNCTQEAPGLAEPQERHTAKRSLDQALVAKVHTWRWERDSELQAGNGGCATAVPSHLRVVGVGVGVDLPHAKGACLID